MATAFQQRHFETIAACLRAEREDWQQPGGDSMCRDLQRAAYQALRSLERRLVNEFTQDNPRFKADTFAKASGIHATPDIQPFLREGALAE